MQATMSGDYGCRKRLLVLFLAAGLMTSGLMTAGAQPATPRRQEDTGGNGGSSSPAAAQDRPSDGSGTAIRGDADPGSAGSQLRFGLWLEGSPEGQRYQSVATRVQVLAAAAGEAGVPLEALMTRMKEAMAKNVAPEVFVQALEADVGNWLLVAALLGGTRWLPAEKAPAFYSAAGNALRNGVGMQTVSTLTSWAMAFRGTSERVGAVLMSVSALSGLMDSLEISRCAVIMASSHLRVGEFDSCAALLKRASAAGRTSSELLAAMEEVKDGRNFIRNLERRLFP